MELFKANRQWSTRPADERFPTLTALYSATRSYADSAFEKTADVQHLRVEPVDDNLQLVGRQGVPARLTNWVFGQLASRVGAPAAYLRDLPATLAAQNLNHGLKQRVIEYGSDTTARLLFHQNGSLVLRAFTSERYVRIWNHEVAERLLELETKGWSPAVPDRVWPQDQQGVTALYASDHDMFAFLHSQNHAIREGGTDQPMWRGIIVENSEVGASALKLTKFLYRYMCGNHIIWGASEVVDLSLYHVGNVRDKMQLFAARVRQYAESSPSDEEAQIERARHKIIAGTKEQVLDAIFGKRQLGLSRKTVGAGYDAVKVEEDGPANTVWGLVQGLTRHSQTIPYADQRTEIDRAAGRVLEATESF